MLVLAAGLGAGCGSDDQEGEPIPPDAAAALQRQLESIENRFQFGGGACADITGNDSPNTTEVRSVLDSLPEDVDPDVRDALERSFDRLFELVQEQCDDEPSEQQQEQEQEPPPAETTPPETTPPAEEEDDDEGDEEEEAPPPEEGTGTEPPVEVPPETPPGQGEDGDAGQGGGGTAGQGGSPGQGGGGGALVPEGAQ
jgi:hypothetical protein